MNSIQTSGFPLLYRVGDNRAFSAFGDRSNDRIDVMVSARALEGMQKEACVQYGPTGTIWHMYCDEGPYLNGTDLAPFPLAFFTAGLAASYLSELLALARQQGTRMDSVELVLNNYYGMEGSALRGTLKASSLPVQVSCQADADASPAQLRQLLQTAVIGSPGDAILRGSQRGTFSLNKNGVPLDVAGVDSFSTTPPPDPEPSFTQALPGADPACAAGGIEKLQAAESVFGVEGGAGSSLHASQKRLLHVRGIASVREDGIKCIKVQLFKPIGGVFHFLSDDSALAGGQERAPSGPAYLAAGIAFCYLTQLGRYAHIVKQQLDGYRVVQDIGFSLPGSMMGGAPGSVSAPDTHTFVNSEDNDESIQKLVLMGEQTCFLHATYQTDNRTQIDLPGTGA